MTSVDNSGIKYRKMVEFRRSRKTFRRSFKQRNDSSTLDFLSAFNYTSTSGVWPFSKTQTAIASIAPVYTDSAWINCFGSNKMTLISRDGKQKRSVRFSSTTTHIAATYTGDILFASDMGHTVKTLTLKGEIKVVYDLSPLVTRGICSMQDGNILVCAISKNGGKLYKISRFDKTVEIIENDENGKPLFQHPYRVIENVNGDICVADIDASCLICLEKSGKVRFRYLGAQRKEVMCKFCPYGLTNNKQGQIIALDYWNHSVHLIDSDGNFIQFIITQLEKIEYPLSVVMDRNECLWVGCKDGHISVVKFST